MNADAAYADLRRRGQVIVPAAQAALVGALRRRAKADGLRVVAGRENARHLSREQARNRAYQVALTVNGVDIVAPDAGSGS